MHAVLEAQPSATFASTASAAQRVATAYLNATLGPAYRVGQSILRQGQWHCRVLCQRTDMQRIPVVGSITVDAKTGLVNPLTADQVRDLREAGAVQSAQARGELARDEDHYVLRYHARIKATVWISDHTDLKVGATGGIFLPLESPVWRFAIDFHLADIHLNPLGVIDVNAQTGQVIPLTNDQLQHIRGCVRAAQRDQTLAAAA
ncbi:MAG: hypothetical protein DYG89_20250 [Caldilinea sp. CFX5]|nr:hypothetical protein [Caldilinea sp. CFX5]